MARHARAHAGSVDQNIDAVPFSPCGFGEPFGLIPVGHVGGDRERAAAELANFVGGGFAGIELAAGDDDVGAALRKRPHHFEAEAATAAGYECDLAGKVKQRVGHGQFL